MISEKMQAIINELNTASLEIPFGNSEFQNLNFVLNAEITPERAYRHCLLRLNNRITALKECYYNLQLEDIDIEEMQEKTETADKFEKRRIVIKIEQKKVNRITTEKMVSDCLEEINTLYGAFKKLPKFTREQFESGERKHFELKLARDFVLKDGALLSLDSMGADKWIEQVISTNGETLKIEIDKIKQEQLQIGGTNNVDKI